MVSPEHRRGRWILIAALLLLAIGAWQARRLWKAQEKAAPVAPVAPPAQAPAPIPPARSFVPKPPPSSKPAARKKTPKISAAPVRLPPPPKPVAPTPVPPPATPLPPSVVAPPAAPEPQEWHGTDSAIIHSGQVVVRTDRQWIRFWSEHRPHEPAPEIDFTRNMVIGIFAGPRPADAFSITITQIQTTARALIVDYREQVPPPGTFAVGVSVSPYHLKVVPRTTLPVKFRQLSS
jgi:hypothetical protein